MFFKMFFTKCAIINKKNGLNTVCDAIAAMKMATVLDGLTEVIGIDDATNELVVTSYYLNGELIRAVQAGEMWGPELAAIIENN